MSVPKSNLSQTFCHIVYSLSPIIDIVSYKFFLCVKFIKNLKEPGDDVDDRKKVVGGLILLGRFLHGPWLALLSFFPTRFARRSCAARCQRRRLFAASLEA